MNLPISRSRRRIAIAGMAALSALAVIIISISLAGAIVFEVLKRREQAKADRAQRRAKAAERSEIAAGELQPASST